MAPRDNIERQFTEDIERLARGQRPPAQDADYAAMLDFAQRLVALKEDPEASFASRLREDLMLKMAEEDAAARAVARPSWFERVFGSRTVRLAVVSTFVVVAAVGLVWRAGLLSPMMPSAGDAGPAPAQEGALEEPEAAADEESAPPPNMIRATEDAPEAEEELSAAAPAVPIVMRAEAARTAVQGENVTVSLFFENTGPDGMTLAPFPPRVTIRDLDSGIIVTSFEAGDSTLPLSVMESSRYDVTWDQQDQAGSQVAPGRYAVDVNQSFATPENDKAEAASLDMPEVAIIEIVAE